MAPIFAGTSQHGFRFAATEMSHFGGGGGARVDADGVDTAGIVFNTTPNMPNIEDQEAEYPVLYLFRRHLPDSGGPGTFRGGRSGELAYTVHDAPDGKLEGLFAGTGAEMPNAIGIAGGFPGAAIRVARVVETDLAARIERGEPLPARLEDVAGKREILECKHERSPILAGEVWYHSWQAGAGYGDPLGREPARVAGDVGRGAVSAGAARAIYGVVLRADGTPELDATARERDGMRRARLAAAKVTRRLRCSAHVRRRRFASLRRCVRARARRAPDRVRALRRSAGRARRQPPRALAGARASRDRRRPGPRRGLRPRALRPPASGVPGLRRHGRCAPCLRRRTASFDADRLPLAGAMAKHIVASDRLMVPIAHFSHGVRVGSTIHLGAAAGVDRDRRLAGRASG